MCLFWSLWALCRWLKTHFRLCGFFVCNERLWSRSSYFRKSSLQNPRKSSTWSRMSPSRFPLIRVNRTHGSVFVSFILRVSRSGKNMWGTNKGRILLSRIMVLQLSARILVVDPPQWVLWRTLRVQVECVTERRIEWCHECRSSWMEVLNGVI